MNERERMERELERGDYEEAFGAHPERDAPLPEPAPVPDAGADLSADEALRSYLRPGKRRTQRVRAEDFHVTIDGVRYEMAPIPVPEAETEEVRRMRARLPLLERLAAESPVPGERAAAAQAAEKIRARLGMAP